MKVKPALQRLKLEYVLGTAVFVDVSDLVSEKLLLDTTLVSVSVFYRAKSQSAPILANASITLPPPPAGGTVFNKSPATGLWSAFKNGFTFTPAVPGFYTVNLTGLTVVNGAVTSLLTVQLDRVCVVKF
jgi:hypothetical protein